MADEHNVALTAFVVQVKVFCKTV